MKDGFFYSLRFSVQPGRQEQSNFRRMLEFCRSARIEDVMFFIDCEELNRGHLTVEETAPWLETIARGKALLQPEGITTSINPWPTLLHGDRGRTLRESQKFTLMTDPYGNETTAVACPLCPEWRRYIAGIYACYAALQPEILWVEDDFRLHNHRPLIWGGCFCEAHMREYSRRAGRALTRGEFVEGVLKPGRPHPFRKIWLDTARDAMVESAAIIGRAVHGVSPGTRVGLMSSCPHVHCAEGRDWAGILTGLAAGNATVSRPTLPAYTEVSPREYLSGFAAYSMLAAASAPEGTQFYPELESFPHSRFSKSRAFTGFQLETSLALGAGGITLNIFDMMGNGILPQEGYQQTLSATKDYLDSVAALGLRLEKLKGVRVLESPASSYTLHTANGAGMEELYPRETFWASLLSSLGIANAYSVGTEPSGEVVAVSGQYFRNLGEEGLRRFFGNNFVIMDAEAAYTLSDMGQGALAGIADTVWHPMESGFQAYEQACDGKTYAGVEQARVSSQTEVGDYLEIKYYGGASLVSEVMSPYGEVAGPGMAVYEGRALVLPYGRTESFQGHLTPVRQAMLQSALAAIDCRYRRPACAEAAPNLLVAEYDLGGKTAVFLGNFTSDETGALRLYLPGFAGDSLLELSKRNPLPVREPVRREGEFIILESGIDALSTKVLLL